MAPGLQLTDAVPDRCNDPVGPNQDQPPIMKSHCPGQQVAGIFRITPWADSLLRDGHAVAINAETQTGEVMIIAEDHDCRTSIAQEPRT